MMDSFFARNRLSAYLDGELPLAEAREVEAAIRRDPELSAEYEAMRRAVDLLRNAGPLKAPEGFAGRLQARLAEEPAPSRARTLFRRIRPETIGIIAIAAIALIVVATPKSDPPRAPAPSIAAARSAPVDPSVEAIATEAPVPSTPAAANGVLGDEGGFSSKPAAPEVAKQSSKLTKPGVAESPEKQAFEAEWEQTQSAQEIAAPTLYAPAPWRFRIRAKGNNPLAELTKVASALGGRVVDARGRPVGDYPMDEGDSKSVRVLVPSYNVVALQRQLDEIGAVDTIATDEQMLYQNGAEIPVAVEVQR